MVGGGKVVVGVVVGASVVGGTEVGGGVVAIGGSVVGPIEVGNGYSVVGGTVVGATVVGANVVGASVVGATVVGAAVVGGEVVLSNSTSPSVLSQDISPSCHLISGILAYSIEAPDNPIPLPTGAVPTTLQPMLNEIAKLSDSLPSGLGPSSHFTL